MSLKNPRLRSLASVLAAARARIEQGWTKWSEHRITKSGQHQFCAIGAVRSVARDSDVVSRAENLLSSVTPTGQSIVNYNDGDSTRRRDVIRVFDRAIKVVSQG